MHSKQKTQKNKEKKSPVPTNHFWCFFSSSIGRNPSPGPWTPETPPTYGVLLFPCTGLHLFVHLRWFNCIIGFYDLVLAERWSLGKGFVFKNCVDRSLRSWKSKTKRTRKRGHKNHRSDIEAGPSQKDMRQTKHDSLVHCYVTCWIKQKFILFLLERFPT